MNVSVGISTKVGYGLTLIGAALTAWATAASHPGVSPETLLIVTIVAGMVTSFGRMLQAAVATNGTTPEVPAALQALAATAQENAAAKGPDGVDHPDVPFSGAPTPAP